MKKLLGLTIFASSLAMASVDHSSQFGIGVMLGEPTGVSGKYNFDNVQSFDFGAGFAFLDRGRFQVHADYLRHARDLFKIGEASFDLHFGIGARVKTRDEYYDNNRNKDKNRSDPKFGVRVPVGIDYTFEQIPLELFGEAALIVDLAPEVDADINAAVGARWYF